MNIWMDGYDIFHEIELKKKVYPEDAEPIGLDRPLPKRSGDRD